MQYRHSQCSISPILLYYTAFSLLKRYTKNEVLWMITMHAYIHTKVIQRLSGILLLMSSVTLLQCAASFTSQSQQPISTPQTERTFQCNEGLKRRVAVLTVENKSYYGQQRVGHAVTDMLTTEIAKSNCFVIVTRHELHKILQEKALQMTGIIQEDRESEAAKLAGAEFLLAGTVTQFSVRTEADEGLFSDSKRQTAEATVDIRLINVLTGEVMLSLRGTGNAVRSFGTVMGMGNTGGYDESLEGDALRKSLMGFAKQIAQNIERDPWWCYAVVKNGQIYLEAGSRINIRIGDTFAIFTRGEAIYSPSGALLGYDEQYTATIQITQFLGADASAGKLIAGTLPKNGGIARKKEQ